jgi:uncharacterized damage-inducible protein DinB
MNGYNAAEELIRCYEGDPWHGPNLKSILSGLTPERAAAKPIPQAHSAWEILLHIDAWHHVVMRRLDGEECKEPPQNFPQPSAITEAAWLADHASFEKKLRLVAERIRNVEDKHVFMVNGVVNHIIYHSGQIAVLEKSR